MAFIKATKSKSYYKRFQTKFRRRREGKTDYYARKRLITQDKDKYDTPKYRLVVRFTNTRVIAQVTYATIQGDKILTSAHSHELKRYGLTAGLSNYAAAYATGLLVARRLLKQTKLDTLYKGAAKIDGVDYDVSNEVKSHEQRKPFKAVLDVGLVNTTKGNKVFAVMKGASDGGIHVPHSTKRFPGTSDDGKYNAALHRERIFGVHVQKYMKVLKDEGEEDYKTQFRVWDETLKAAKVDTVEKLYTKIFDEIRKNPDAVPKKAHEKKPVKYLDKRQTIIQTSKSKYKRDRRFTREERKQRVIEKIKKAASK
jgi:large subunit ribosomal protein L5e